MRRICGTSCRRAGLVARQYAGRSTPSAMSSFWRRRIRSGTAVRTLPAVTSIELCIVWQVTFERFPSTQSGSRRRAAPVADVCLYLCRNLHNPAIHLPLLQACCPAAAKTGTDTEFKSANRSSGGDRHACQLSSAKNSDRRGETSREGIDGRNRERSLPHQVQ